MDRNPSVATISAGAVRRRRRASQIVSVLKSLTNSVSQKSIVVEKIETASKGHRTKLILSNGLSRMHGALLRAPMEPTVIHRVHTKARPSVQQAFPPQAMPIESLPFTPPSSRSDQATTNSNATSSGKISTGQSNSPKNSTGQTSLDSMSKDKGKGKGNRRDIQGVDGSSTPERRPHQHRNHQHNDTPMGRHQPSQNNSQPNLDDISNSPDSTLTTIQESPLDQASPTILTVERVAAAKIALETHFNAMFSGPSERPIRKQLFEADLLARSRETKKGLASEEFQAARQRFYQRETDHLREIRVMKTRSLAAMRGGGDKQGKSGGISGISHDFEEVRILGKGSFGVVKLVRERTDVTRQRRMRGKVFAMKCIRKGDMLKTQQEGHLRAERDFLVASEGSRWIIQLVASFQDLKNLYLVTEYMPGGDFLGFLIRENTLPEPTAKFYVAEMILCVEAAHSLKFIHRDIKPDNFLISASGHLKISDFGLAFDGHWSHDMAYYNSHRYSLVHKLGIPVEGDEQDKKDSRSLETSMKLSSNIMTSIQKHQRPTNDGEPLLNWRNRCGNRAAAMSVVGTSQYMAPEVVMGNNYDARCDYWSVAVILYECLYGQTPFYSEDGRNVTKKNILNHREIFHFPHRPAISNRCQHLMASLITDKESRLCSKRYRMRDLVNTPAPCLPGPSPAAGSSSTTTAGPSSPQPSTPTSPTAANPRISKDYAGRYVFPYDAEDIKAHKWFRNIPWEHLHLMKPPRVPYLSGEDDTSYFKEESVSDWSDTEASDQEEAEGAYPVGPTHRAAGLTPKSTTAIEQEQLQFLSPLKRQLQNWVLSAIAFPIDEGRLGQLEEQIDTLPNLTLGERDHMKEFIWRYGKKKQSKPRDTKKKRARDKILRDKKLCKVVLEERRKTAFTGYEWKRMANASEEEEVAVYVEEVVSAEGQENNIVIGLDGGCEVARNGEQDYHYHHPHLGGGDEWWEERTLVPSGQQYKWSASPLHQHQPHQFEYEYYTRDQQQQQQQLQAQQQQPRSHHKRPHQQWYAGCDAAGFGAWGDDAAAVRALHKGRMSLR